MEIKDIRELALKKVKITGNVIGKFGTFEIEQTYKNNTKEILEVGYTFPMVETATVIGFEVNVGNKILKGKCMEKQAARREYENNIIKGNSAYMMEQETNNIFKIFIGKIDKNEEVKIKIKFIDKFEIVDNTIQILLPTLVTPKYKSSITNKLMYGKVKYTVDFNINIDKSINRKSISCPSHKVNLIDEESTERVEVLNYDLSRDFKLNIELKNELSSTAIISKTKDEKDIMYLSFMPEILDAYEDSEKEYIFIIDISGSMAGEKLSETKNAVIECLKQLDIGDKFNIIPFESEFTAMNIESIEYNEDNMKKAIEYINSLQALGGTEILNPIKFALYDNKTEKTILLFTDGQVMNESKIIEYVKYNVNRSRIFPFGIDKNVNTYFIKQLAKIGNGKAEFIQPGERIDDKVIRTFARIQTPLLEEMTIDYGNNKVIDEIKEEKNLFNYEFYNVFVKIENLEDDIKLKGKILDKEYIWKIDKNSIKNTNVDLETLFAKQEIDRLEDYMINTHNINKIETYKEMIVELSEKYNINSRFTSFITVYERENKLFEVPKYQETELSSEFLDCEQTMNIGIPVVFRSSRGVSRCSARKYGLSQDYMMTKETDKTNEIIMEKKIDEYYKIFISQKEKSILTFLLYALYYLKKQPKKFNYDNMLVFLEKHRSEILENELYLKLLCLCYRRLGDNNSLAKSKTFGLLDDNFKKVLSTNCKIGDITIKKLNQNEIQEFINSDTVREDINIDSILWILLK